MGTGVLLPSSPTPPHLCSHTGRSRATHQSNTSRRFPFSVKAGGRVGGSEWERTSTRTHNAQSRYDEDDEFDYYDEEEFDGFRNTRKQQRIWWSDDDDYDDDDVLDGLGILQGSVGFSSIFKVLKSFGWMVPAIVISMLLGTGTNTFVMALALPLAQSALSLVFDMLWGRPTHSRRPKTKSQKRKRTSAGAASRSRMREEKEQSSQNSKRVDDSQSWAATNNVSAKKGEGRRWNFGGWDELDKERRMQEEPNTTRKYQKRWETEGKLSKRARNRRTPLLVRLLIAFFPFLGFWTKLL